MCTKVKLFNHKIYNNVTDCILDTNTVNNATDLVKDDCDVILK